MIQRFEEISNNAWPALQTFQYDGWLLRFANGVTKRSNSVSMLYPSHIDPAEKIRVCEMLYQAKAITPCFKITADSNPPGMDQLLETSGYYRHSTISFQTADIKGRTSITDPETMVETSIRESWIDDFIRMNGFDFGKKATYLAIMQQVQTSFALVSVIRNRKVVGVGLGVLERDFLGIFDIVVDPGHRRQGLGFRIVDSILCWGKEQGATTAYLQVLADNHTAISLYRKMGFTERYKYWYRMKKAGNNC